ncbi:MAG: hypothetical protein J7497_01775 [Chitinophagaceae bacterium]|nr:hypothetical protein [Chitinophagaceae bacterium]
MDYKVNLQTRDFATKKDITDLWTAMRQDINDLKFRTEQDINSVRLEVSGLSARMEQGFKDQLKWTIVLMVSFLSIMIAITKFM